MATVKLSCADGLLSSLQVLDANDAPIENVKSVLLTKGVNDQSEAVFVAELTIGPIAVLIDDAEMVIVVGGA